MKFEEFKKAYAGVEKKYSMPSLDELNRYFDLDKVEREVEYVLREIRKCLFEKIAEFMKLTEMMLNPAQAPPMFLQFVRQINSEDRKTIEKIYSDFVSIGFTALRNDLKYDEKSEAEAIKSAFNLWKGHVENMNNLVDMMEKNFNFVPGKKDKSYFG